MKDFLRTDPNVVLPSYFMAVSRRVAHAQLFGPNGEILKTAQDRLNRIDGMDGHDVTSL